MTVSEMVKAVNNFDNTEFIWHPEGLDALANMISYYYKFPRDLIYLEGLESVLGNQELYRHITKRERIVLYLRFENRLSLDQVAKEFGVTRERIRQIQAKAIRKLYAPRWNVQYRFICPEVHMQLAEDYARLKTAYDELATAYDKKFGREIDDEPYSKKMSAVIEETKIDELELSVRAYNQLKRADINTLADLDGMSIDDLMGIRHLGRRSVEEIIEKAKPYGIEFRNGGEKK